MEDAQFKKQKARSPSYPSISLKEAVEKAQSVYNNDYQNQIPRIVIASHMGYNGLNGKSLGVLSALSKYGLLEGRGNDNKVSDLAVRIIAHGTGTAERAEALKEAASKPELFAELDARFGGGRVSDAAIRSYLLTQKFIPSAADAAIRSYRETKDFVQAESAGYNPPIEQDNGEEQMQQAAAQSTAQQPIPPANPLKKGEIQGHIAGTRRAVFALSEGDVVITFPEDLSQESVNDLADYLEIFMKKAKREAGIN